MPQYKLTYFDGRARAEVCRLIFAAAGVKYQDDRIPVSVPPKPEQLQAWLDLKPQTPFGQLPILEVNGQVIPQSHTIERYLAREYGFYGADNFEMSLTDMWVDNFDDLIAPIIRYNFGPASAAEKEDNKKTYLDTTLPQFYERLDDDLKRGTTGFLVGKSLTLADLYVLHHTDWMLASLGEEGKAALKKFPNVQQHIKRIAELPNIATWLAKRPQTKF